MDDIQQLHIDHGYYISVKPLSGSFGCVINFPPNRLKKIPLTHRTYILCPESYGIEIYTAIDGHIHSNMVQATSSNIRLLVLQDIMLTAFDRHISKELIVVEDTEKNLFQMLEIPQTKKEKELETQLCVNFRELLAGNVVASDLEGYEQVFLCFENGGL